MSRSRMRTSASAPPATNNTRPASRYDRVESDDDVCVTKNNHSMKAWKYAARTARLKKRGKVLWRAGVFISPPILHPANAGVYVFFSSWGRRAGIGLVRAEPIINRNVPAHSPRT